VNASLVKMVGSLAVLHRKGRTLTDAPRQGRPRTVRELIATIDSRSGKRPSSRPTPSGYDFDELRRQIVMRMPPCRSRTGGPIVPGPNALRVAPVVETSRDEFRLEALWAMGAVEWLRRKKIAVDLDGPACLDGPLTTIRGDGRKVTWNSPLAHALSDGFLKATEWSWCDLAYIEPTECENGLRDLAEAEAFVQTYDAEGAEDANPALVLLDKVCAAFQQHDVPFGLGEFEGLLEALRRIRLGVPAAQKSLSRICTIRDYWALPPYWGPAIRGVRAWDQFTDGSWMYWDPAECSCGSVERFDDDPVAYFEFVESLVGAREKLFAACGGLVEHVCKKTTDFWNELARSLHAAIEEHPQWKIDPKEGLATGGPKPLAEVLAGEDAPKATCPEARYGGPGAGGCPPPVRVRARTRTRG